jgi:hypothetical protein
MHPDDRARKWQGSLSIGRVELHGTPKVVACALSRGRYVTRTTLVAGTLGRITRPFPVELDPADLTRRTP